MFFKNGLLKCGHEGIEQNKHSSYCFRSLLAVSRRVLDIIYIEQIAKYVVLHLKKLQQQPLSSRKNHELADCFNMVNNSKLRGGK